MNCELINSAFLSPNTWFTVHLFFWFCFSGKIIDQVPKDIRDSGKLHIIWLVKLALEILNLPSIFPQRLCKGEKRKRKGSKERKPYPTFWFSLLLVNLRYIWTDWTTGSSWPGQCPWHVFMGSARAACAISSVVERLRDSCYWGHFFHCFIPCYSLTRNTK